jgi:transketolase
MADVDMYFIKPLDEELILKAVEETGKIIVVEDHLKRGGLSGAVAELLVDKESFPKKICRMGIPDVYAGYGPGTELREKYGYGKTAITQKIKEFA